MKSLTILPALLSLLGGASLATESPRCPNLVFILADDLGVGSVNCYHAATNLVRTPNIDRLARDGRRFTDANTPASVCSPTRYAVLTGRYCWRTSLKHEVLAVGDPLWIETNRLTVASLLQRQGYHTAAIGKWHLGYGPTNPVNYTPPSCLAPGMSGSIITSACLPTTAMSPASLWTSKECSACAPPRWSRLARPSTEANPSWAWTPRSVKTSSSWTF